MRIKAVGRDRYAEIKVTRISYCQSCGINFVDPEIVFFAVIDNNIVCRECAKAHTTKEPRLFVEEG